MGSSPNSASVDSGAMTGSTAVIAGACFCCRAMLPSTIGAESGAACFGSGLIGSFMFAAQHL